MPFGEPDTPEGDCEKLELLCDGQQIICFGVHPDTGKAYSWHADDPREIKREDLPYIHAEEAQALVDDAAKLLVEKFGYRLREAKSPKPGNGAEAPGDWSFTPDDLTDHDKLTALTMKLVKSGMSSGAAVNFLRSAVAGLANIDEERRQRRLNEIPGMVSSAGEKIAADEPAHSGAPRPLLKQGAPSSPFPIGLDFAILATLVWRFRANLAVSYYGWTTHIEHRFHNDTHPATLANWHGLIRASAEGSPWHRGRCIRMRLPLMPGFAYRSSPDDDGRTRLHTNDDDNGGDSAL